MQHAVRWARNAGCEGIELTSGIRAERELAHKVYEGVSFVRTSCSFWLPLTEDEAENSMLATR
jgi:hypothetical protein